MHKNSALYTTELWTELGTGQPLSEVDKVAKNK